MINDEAKIQVLDDCKENYEGIQVRKFFATATAYEIQVRLQLKLWNGIQVSNQCKGNYTPRCV